MVSKVVSLPQKLGVQEGGLTEENNEQGIVLGTIIEESGIVRAQRKEWLASTVLGAGKGQYSRNAQSWGT